MTDNLFYYFFISRLNIPLHLCIKMIAWLRSLCSQSQEPSPAISFSRNAEVEDNRSSEQTVSFLCGAPSAAGASTASSPAKIGSEEARETCVSTKHRHGHTRRYKSGSPSSMHSESPTSSTSASGLTASGLTASGLTASDDESLNGDGISVLAAGGGVSSK